MGIQRLEYCQGVPELLIAEPGLPEKRPDILLREEIRVAREYSLGIAHGLSGIRDLTELGEEALLHGPGACSNRIKVPDALQDHGNLVRLDVSALYRAAVLLVGEELSGLLLALLDEDLGGSLGDVIIALLQVAVVVDSVNDGSRYRLVAFGKRRERELPDEMLLQGLLGMPLRLELFVVNEG